MIMALYSFPLPNNGDRYDLSEKELTDLLQQAYNNGYKHAREIFDPKMHQVTTTSTEWSEYQCDCGTRP